MRWHLLWGAALTLALFDICLSPFHLQVASAQQPAIDRRTVAPPRPLAGNGAATAGQNRPGPQESRESTVRISPSATHRLAADPFKYRAPVGSEGFVPANIQIPRGIKVLGILMLGSGHSLAALQLPGDDEVFYVSEDDDLQIRSTDSPGRTPAPSPPGGPVAVGVGSGIFYLKVKAITPRHVEVFPEHSPTNIQILR